MADNVQLNAGAGGDVAASDDIGGIQYQRVKLTWGADGIASDTTAVNPLPVSLSGVQFIFATPTTTVGSQQISGSVVATLSGENFIYATLTGTTFVIATPTGSQQISGSVTATLSGTNYIFATQSGSYGISGNVGATQSGTWFVYATQSGSYGVSGSVAVTLSGTNFIIATPTGSQQISGSVAATLSGINFIVATLSTGTSTIGGTYDVSRRIINERGAVVIASDSFANATSAGNTEVVAAQGSGIIVRVLSGTVMSTENQLIKFQSGTTDISPSYPVISRGGFHWAYNPHGHCQTRPNEALNINLGMATQTACQVSWCTTN